MARLAPEIPPLSATPFVKGGTDLSPPTATHYVNRGADLPRVAEQAATRLEITPVVQFIDRIKQRYADRITGELVLHARAPSYSDLPSGLDDRIARALRMRGVNQLYGHQREAWEAVIRGHHVVIATPTASGKSLCYNLPVLQAAVHDRAKALYLFPTKALSQDQVAELLELNEAGGLGIRAYTFDGDTAGEVRKAVRLHGDIVVSNPDMLHQGILPHHTKWAQFFENLRFVVIDEMHVYRGVFGSHVANVVRRLRRVCRFYGSTPRFLLSSATIANPGELGAQLIGAPVTTITRSGAPQGRKHVLLWNPPVMNADLGLRASHRSQSTRIARAALKSGLKTIIFANTRLMVEVLTKYMKDVFDSDPRKPARVSAYRGGYLPSERRGTERKLRAGEIDCVVTTNALELGVDIGLLDVCVLSGYPGTIASTWQRLGRAGRRDRPSLGVLVASSEPLDQYIVRNPDFFLGASIEHARIDADQLLILMDHIRCAAFELAFTEGECYGNRDLPELLSYLQEHNVLHFEGGRWHWMADGYPANSVSLRSVSDGNFVVIDSTDGKKEIIAEVDFSSASLTLYDGAIYMVQAQPWQVQRLDWEGRRAYVTRTRADYYTEAIDYTRLSILDEFDSVRNAAANCAHGEVHLVRRVAGYKKIRYYTHENVGYGSIHLPDHEMHTTAVWWQVDPERLAQTFASRMEALAGICGAAYAMHHVATLVTMSERRDLGRAVGDGSGSWFATARPDTHAGPRSFSGGLAELDSSQPRFVATLFLYDDYPGGVGLSPALFDLRNEVVRRAAELVAACECSFGCPACVGPSIASDTQRRYSPKGAAARVLALLQSSLA